MLSDPLIRLSNSRDIEIATQPESHSDLACEIVDGKDAPTEAGLSSSEIPAKSGECLLQKAATKGKGACSRLDDKATVTYT